MGGWVLEDEEGAATTLANAPVYVEPGPRSCGRCCGEEPRLAARTGGQGGRRKDPNTIHGEPLL